MRRRHPFVGERTFGGGAKGVLNQTILVMLPDEEKFLNLKQLPARLSVEETAWHLGFATHVIQILMAVGKLTPLGDPAPNAPKWFVAVEMIRLATDRDWLDKATKEISNYWLNKRERHQTPAPARQMESRE